MQPKIWTDSADEEFAAAIFQQHRLDPKRTVALFAGAQYELRKYPYYGNAIAAACKERNLSLIALGGREDAAINMNNLKDAGVIGVNLSGQTTLRQAAAILWHCRIAIGAETGLAHIACAVGTPNVILLGGGHFGRFMPYSPLTTVACLPIECFGCNWECRYKRIHCTWDLDPIVLSVAFTHALDQPSTLRPTVFCQDPTAWQTRSAVTNKDGLAVNPPRWVWPARLTKELPLDIWLVGPDAVPRRMDPSKTTHPQI
jgi:hypothetical protein